MGWSHLGWIGFVSASVNKKDQIIGWARRAILGTLTPGASPAAACLRHHYHIGGRIFCPPARSFFQYLLKVFVCSSDDDPACSLDSTLVLPPARCRYPVPHPGDRQSTSTSGTPTPRHKSPPCWTDTTTHDSHNNTTYFSVIVVHGCWRYQVATLLL